MTYVYVLITSDGFILGVFSSMDKAERVKAGYDAKVVIPARISCEPVIGS